MYIHEVINLSFLTDLRKRTQPIYILIQLPAGHLPGSTMTSSIAMSPMNPFPLLASTTT